VPYILSCSTRKHTNNEAHKNSEIPTMNKDALLAHVKQAINPKFTNWVLFSNGTYIILEDTVQNKQQVALNLMKEYGPVYTGSPAGDFSIISLNQTEGWIVTSHYYGMYTYVHPSEINSEKPSDIDIGLFGRSKREKDAMELEIIHIN
jgi:hypothetical protein